MAIKVDANARMQGLEGQTDATEEVYLPGPFKGADEEGPFDFNFPRMGRILKMQRTLTSLTDVAAVLESSKATTAWLAEGFGPDAWAYIVARLDDDNDLLDDEHLQWLFVQLQKSNTGRPTTSSNGAVRQPWKKPSTAAPSLPASDSEN
jgi:hypothetical protein